MAKATALFVACTVALAACGQQEQTQQESSNQVSAEPANVAQATYPEAVEARLRTCYTSKEVRVALRLYRDPQIRAALGRHDPDLVTIRNEICFQAESPYGITETDFLDSSIGDDPTLRRISAMTPEGTDHILVTAALVDLSEGL